jgi:hypothetical protein
VVRPANARTITASKPNVSRALRNLETHEFKVR